MRYRQLGKTEFQVSVVSLGTWAFSGKDYGRVDERDAIKAVWRAVDLGVNLFDTAPIYGGGRAEEILGRALESLRKEVLIATKCGPVEVRPGLIRTDLSREGIEAQCDQSLRRLRTDWIDILQVHWSDPAYPIEEVMEGLMRLVEAGKVRAIGVSNFSLEELRKACEVAPVASAQYKYNLVARGVEKDILPFCISKGVGFLAYEPLARGLLAGKMDVKRRFEEGDVRRTDPDFQGERFYKRCEAAARLAELARSQGISAAQLAIGWLLAREGVTSVIVGAKDASQAVENIRGAQVELDEVTAERAAKVMAPVAEGLEG